MEENNLKSRLTVQVCKMLALISLLTISFSAGAAVFLPIMAVKTDTYGLVYTWTSYLGAWGLSSLITSALIHFLPIIELYLKNQEVRKFIGRDKA